MRLNATFRCVTVSFMHKSSSQKRTYDVFFFSACKVSYTNMPVNTQMCMGTEANMVLLLQAERKSPNARISSIFFSYCA